MLSFEEIVRKPQYQLKKALMGELNKAGYKTNTKQGFIYAKGSVPVLLVAHLDTVHREAPELICYSADKQTVMSPQGIGGDDRCGVYMVLQIIKKHKCHVLFCEDEEIGGIGAGLFVKSNIKPDVNYIVELDRRGDNDAVFYDCDNPEFAEFVTSFGFREAMGSFSDISIIAPELKIAAVNISSGYYNEHSKHEYVDLSVVAKNIERIEQMVSAKSKKFEYIETDYLLHGRWGRSYYEDIIDFDSYYAGNSKPRIALLMPLPESAYIKLPSGEFIENFGDYFIDDCGKVYEYLYDVDVAVETSGFSAVTAQNTPLPFRFKDAMEIEVLPPEYVYGELLEQEQEQEQL
jgi:hypothetical protein